MKCAIYVVDDFRRYKNSKHGWGSGKTWFDYGRKMLYSYADRMNIPVVNVTTDHKLYKKFYDTFTENATDQAKAKFKKLNIHNYVAKAIREYAFLESDYDYAFFCDLDFIGTNTEVNIKDLVDGDTYYLNAYNHVGRGRLVDLKEMITKPVGQAIWANFKNEWAAGFRNRYQIIKHFDPNKDYRDLVAVTTGFFCYGKQTGYDIVEFYNEHDINPMTSYGIKNMCKLSEERAFPVLFDEEYLTWAVNLGNLKFKYANMAGLCDEIYFANDEPCVFWHGPTYFDHDPRKPEERNYRGWMYR